MAAQRRHLHSSIAKMATPDTPRGINLAIPCPSLDPECLGSHWPLVTCPGFRRGCSSLEEIVTLPLLELVETQTAALVIFADAAAMTGRFARRPRQLASYAGSWDILQ